MVSLSNQTRGEEQAILIVDDDELIREMLCVVLEFEGYKAVAVEHGIAALEYLKSHAKPSLVLLDLMMPVMNGRDFVHAVRGIPDFSGLPIVVVTAFGNKVEGLPVQGCVAKPMEMETLLATVKRFHSS